MNLFVDESKAGRYLLVAAVLPDSSVATTRREVQHLLLPGQSRIHMKNERRERKAQLSAGAATLDARYVVIDAGRSFSTERKARAACLGALVATQPAARHLTLEADESLIDFDRRTLFDAVRRCEATLSYRHASAVEEPLLSLPDIVAWCWARGGHWRDRVRPVVQRIEVPR